jgi:hypothetical protein
MKLLHLVFLIILYNHSFSQGFNILEGNTPCGCDVLLYTAGVLDPGLPPEPIPDGSTLSYTDGYLDKFVEYKNGICKRSVIVKSRYVENNQVYYQLDLMVNDINTLLEKYYAHSTFCFKGEFILSNTISLKQTKLLKFLDETVITYTGDGNTPAISFDGIGSSIQGGEIITGVPMSEGLIRIASDGLAVNSNRFSNSIKDITLTSTATNSLPVNAANAKLNRAINLSNNFESMVSQSENGTNYFANISNVDISGFAVGLNLRGWSNAALIRDIRFENISSYGMWVSGCVDNSFSNLSYTNCNTATAIRLDNFVDERYKGFDLGDQEVVVSDPNQRVRLLTNLQLEPIIDASIDQLDFNQIFGALTQLNNSATPANYENAPTYYAILESCGQDVEKGIDPFNNEVDANTGALLRFGLKGYARDAELINNNPLYPNYLDDSAEILDIINDPSASTPLYKGTFFRPDANVGDDEVSLSNGATCTESSGLTNFFLRPSLNSFTGVNIYNSADVMQVSELVVLEEREDDLDLCQQVNETPNSQCDECFYSFNGSPRFAFGFRNSIYLCNLPQGITISGLTQNTNQTECNITNAISVQVLK